MPHVDHDDDFDRLFPLEPEPALLLADREPAPLELSLCPNCGGPGESYESHRGGYDPEKYDRWREQLNCETCDGVGFIRVPMSLEAFRQSRPGSVERIAIMCARYRAGQSAIPEARTSELQWA